MITLGKNQGHPLCPGMDVSEKPVSINQMLQIMQHICTDNADISKQSSKPQATYKTNKTTKKCGKPDKHIKIFKKQEKTAENRRKPEKTEENRKKPEKNAGHTPLVAVGTHR